MAPKLVDLRKIEQLAADEAPSREGTWWIMLQTAESICNCASLRDPVNNAFLQEFWSDAITGVQAVLDTNASRPLPYDDLMQIVSYCGDQLQSVIKNPRHNIVKVDKMVMPYRVKNAGPKTMNWLGKQPGKTIKEKLSGKNKMLNQVNEYSYNIRENQIAMVLYRQIMRRVADRVNYGIKTGAYDDTHSNRMQQLQYIKKSLRESPLAEVSPQNHNQPNNALLSDKNYSVIWRAYLNMAKYDARLEAKWNDALALYVRAVFFSINAELLSYQDVYVVENRNRINGMGDLQASYVIGYHWQIPFVVEVSYSGNGIDITMYDAPLNGSEAYDSELRITLNAKGNHDSQELESKRGLPIIWTVIEDSKIEISEFADLAGIRTITSFLMNRLFPFAQVDSDKREPLFDHIEGSIAFDVVANGDYIGVEDEEKPTVPIWGSRYAVSYPDSVGGCTFYPGGDRGIHYNSEDLVTISDAVTDQNNEGLKIALEEIRNKVILDRDDYFFYLVPDALEEILQKSLKQCVKSHFTRTFPVWRSVAALTYWLANPDYSFEEDSVFAYVDLVGDTATAGMLTIHSEKFVKGYVCNHFPPFPQVDEGDSITENAFCQSYVTAYAEKYGFDIPETVVSSLVRSGSIKSLMLRDSYANQFINIAGRTSVYQITYDEELTSECMDKWLIDIRRFWKRNHQRFDSTRKPNHAIFLSDIMINLLFQLKKEDDLSSVFDEDEQEGLFIYQSSSDLILKGALLYKDRLNKHLSTWTEYLPHLSLEVIRDGDYAELELIGDDVSFDVMGDDNEHVVEEKLVLKANEKEFSFPLIKQDISRKSTMIDAYISDKSFPLDHDVVVSLAVKYRYGFDNSYELTLRPEDEKEVAFKEFIVEWSNTNRKSNVVNIWPAATNKLEDKIVLKAIVEARDSFIRIQSSIEKHMVNYVSYNDKSYPIKKTDQFLSRNTFKLRNVVLSDLLEAHEFIEWFISTPLYRYVGQIAGLFKHQDIPDSFFDDNYGKQMSYFQGDCLQVMFSLGKYTPESIQKYFVNQYDSINEKSRMKAMIDMLLRNGSNKAAISKVIDEIKEAPDQDTYSVRMYALVRELGRMCCFDSELIYDFYDTDPAFMHSMTYYVINGIERMLNKCERFGEEYNPDRKTKKMYISYMVALLSLLRLRDPDKASGFQLLVVASDESKKLARVIRTLDDYMSKERAINPTLRFKLNKPESLSKMSDLCYAIDLYLNGDKQAASIEVVGVDEDD